MSLRLSRERGAALVATTLALSAMIWVAHPSAGTAATNVINTVAGTGTAGYNGDGIAATAAQLSVPIDVAPTADGGFLIADEGNDRIRKVLGGTITTVAGTGADADGGDGPATQTPLKKPLGVAEMPGGGFLIADYEAHKVRRVFPDGSMQTIAGNGTAGFSGDQGPATSAQLNSPARAVPSADGGILVVDQQNQRIRKVANGVITTVAGNGAPGFSGDGGPATAAQLQNPEGIAALANGGFLIADTGNHRIRLVGSGGRISTIAGNGTAGSSGDGVPATSASLNAPADVAVAPNGEIVIADNFSHLIRVVDATGTIRTLAGTPDTPGFAGDGLVATSAQFNLPYGVGVDAGGDVFVADHLNHRVRRIDSDLAAAGATASCAGKRATIVGTDGADTLTGTGGKDVIAALGGNDRVKAGGGNDRVCGGPGKDRLSGQGGKDKLKGQAGRDRLRGGGGKDTLKGGPGKDTCVGGPGKDKAKCEKERSA